jgi:hypothetical protein
MYQRAIMKNLSTAAKIYILSVILVGLGLIVWIVTRLDWTSIGLYVLSALGAVAQTLKVEGPNNRTNYSIAWFVYGFAFVALGPAAASLVILVSHLVEWVWHKYPWYIQSFNIANHILAVSIAGGLFTALHRDAQPFDLRSAVALAAANLVFILANHFLVGLVVKLARGQSFRESGVFEFLTLFLDFSDLCLTSQYLASLPALQRPACARSEAPASRNERTNRPNEAEHNGRLIGIKARMNQPEYDVMPAKVFLPQAL